MFKSAINKCTYIHTYNTHTHTETDRDRCNVYKAIQENQENYLQIIRFVFKKITKKKRKHLQSLKHPFNS